MRRRRPSLFTVGPSVFEHHRVFSDRLFICRSSNHPFVLRLRVFVSGVSSDASTRFLYSAAHNFTSGGGDGADAAPMSEIKTRFRWHSRTLLARERVTPSAAIRLHRHLRPQTGNVWIDLKGSFELFLRKKFPGKVKVQSNCFWKSHWTSTNTNKAGVLFWMSWCLSIRPVPALPRFVDVFCFLGGAL